MTNVILPSCALAYAPDVCSVALRSLAAGPRDERGEGPHSIGIDCEADC